MTRRLPTLLAKAAAYLFGAVVFLLFAILVAALIQGLIYG